MFVRTCSEPGLPQSPAGTTAVVGAVAALVPSPLAACSGTVSAGAGAATGVWSSSVPSPTAAAAGVVSATFTPAALTGLALWLDGSQSAFSDTGGTTPANAPLGRVRRIDQPSPLAGSWLAADDSVRPFRDAASLCFETVPNTASLYGHALSAPAGTTLPANTHTLAITFVSRHSPLITTGSVKGFITGLDSVSGNDTGLVENVGFLMYSHNNTLWNTGIQVPLGTRVTAVVRATPTGLDIKTDVGGIVTTNSFTGTIAAGTLNTLRVGVFARFTEGFHGSLSQLVGVSRAISDSERDSLLTWMVAQTPATAFPSTVNFVALSGDSIAAAFGLSSYQGWAFRQLPALQAVGPQIKFLNLGIPSDTIAGAQAKYTANIAPLFSASRAKNILIVQIGTNSVAFGTKTAAQNITDVYALCDGARADGYKVVLCTLLPRSDAGIRGTFNADRATINADYVTNWASHADAFCRFDTVAGMGADGDSDNLTNYQDKVHPTPTGAGLLLPVIQAATVSLL